MKRLINILNSLMILTSSTALAVGCNKLKSLYDSDLQKKQVSKDFNDNEENTEGGTDQNGTGDNEITQAIEELKKIKKFVADIIADGKNTVANLVSELNQSKTIKSITKSKEFSIILKDKQEDLLKANDYIFTIVFDEEHKVELIAEVYDYDKNLAGLDEAKKHELISSKLSEYLKNFNIKADGENKFINLKNYVSEEIKRIVKPYNIKSNEINIEITNAYFGNDEDIFFKRRNLSIWS